MLVHPAGAGLDALHELLAARQITGPDGAAEPVVRLVGLLEHVFEIAVLDHRQRGAELLLVDQPESGARIGDDGGRIEVPRTAERSATGDDAGAVRVWSPNDGTIRLTVKHAMSVRSMRFNQDGKMLVTGSYDKTAVGWDTAAGTVLWRVPTTQPVVAVDVNGNGDVAVGGQNGSVWFRRASGMVTELQAHTASVTTASFSRDGRFLLTAGVDGSAKLWNTETLTTTATFGGLGVGKVTGAFAPNGETFAVVGRGGFVRPIQSTPGQTEERYVLRSSAGPSSDQENSVVFGPLGYFATVGERGVRVWDARGNLVADAPDQTSLSVVDVEPHPHDPQFVVADNRGHALIWDFRAMTVNDLNLTPAALHAAQFSPDGRWVVTAGDDARAAVWDPTDMLTPPGSSFEVLLDRAKTVMPKVVVGAQAARGSSAQ